MNPKSLDVCSDVDGTLSEIERYSKHARLDDDILDWLDTKGREYRKQGLLTFTPLTGRSPDDFLNLIEGRIDLFDGAMTDFGMSRILENGESIHWNCGGHPAGAELLAKVGASTFRIARDHIISLKIPGLYWEEKRYGGVFHTRPCEEHMDSKDLDEIEDQLITELAELIDDVPRLGIKRGSRCIEVVPDISKLTAYKSHRHLNQMTDKSIPAFFGDDIADLPVLEQVARVGGVAVLVGDRTKVNYPKIHLAEHPGDLIGILENAISKIVSNELERGHQLL